MEFFKARAGINMVAVIYKGGAQAITDTIGGQVHLTMNNPLHMVKLYDSTPGS